jgi:hypothetical protein
MITMFHTVAYNMTRIKVYYMSHIVTKNAQNDTPVYDSYRCLYYVQNTSLVYVTCSSNLYHD